MHGQRLLDAGFSEEQADALLETFSLIHHKHDIDDVEDLADELAALEPEEVDEEGE